jgi:hypothetical protein
MGLRVEGHVQAIARLGMSAVPYPRFIASMSSAWRRPSRMSVNPEMS